MDRSYHAACPVHWILGKEVQLFSHLGNHGVLFPVYGGKKQKKALSHLPSPIPSGVADRDATILFASDDELFLHEIFKLFADNKPGRFTIYLLRASSSLWDLYTDGFRTYHAGTDLDFRSISAITFSQHRH